MSQNVFADEWRECLRTHYLHVIRVQDKVTEPSLTVVMHEAGFSDAELRQLRLRATLRADAVGGDFVPDLEILTPPQPLPAGREGLNESPQAEVTDEPQVFAVLEMPESVVEEVQPVTDEDERASDKNTVMADEDIEPPQQLSLF